MRGFLARLDAAGSPRYAIGNWFELPGDLTTDAAGNAALTGSKFHPMPFLDLLVVRPTGDEREGALCGATRVYPVC
jgi:hypothetical protein